MSILNQFTGTGSQPKLPVVRHVLQLGIDGLKPSCMLDAPGGASNIMSRLAKLGTYTLDRARTVLVTVSGPSWSAMLCGMGIEYSGIYFHSQHYTNTRTLNMLKILKSTAR